MTDSSTTYGGFDGAQPSAAATGRAVVVVPATRMPSSGLSSAKGRDSTARLEEAVGLARAIDLEIADALIVPLAEIRPSTLFGSGKVAELAERVAEGEAGLVVIDHPLSPVQQRNLEKALHAKVIDRTGLILEIFGERAQTREGSLQVELAHLNYQRSRLVRSWTHLERQRGGFGFLGGPGETQIEADRRVIDARIAKIERELATVATRRRLQRHNRRRAATPVAALVGYTNAGKSTLFNALCKSDRFADDRLFATLDPTLRRVRLPRGGEIILSDTVGFIADLPTTLIAAFRATLEEVTEADVVLHVRDIAHADSETQAKDVSEILAELGIDVTRPGRTIEVWNKIDLLPEYRRPQRMGGSVGPPVVAVSALTGEGLDALLDAIQSHLTSLNPTFQVELSGEGLRHLHRLYEYGDVIDRTDAADGRSIIRVRVAGRNLSRFHRLFPDAQPGTTTGAACDSAIP